jgi:hypothetical protein
MLIQNIVAQCLHKTLSKTDAHRPRARPPSEPDSAGSLKLPKGCSEKVCGGLCPNSADTGCRCKYTFVCACLHTRQLPCEQVCGCKGMLPLRPNPRISGEGIHITFLSIPQATPEAPVLKKPGFEVSCPRNRKAVRKHMCTNSDRSVGACQAHYGSLRNAGKPTVPPGGPGNRSRNSRSRLAQDPGESIVSNKTVEPTLLSPAPVGSGQWTLHGIY